MIFYQGQEISILSTGAMGVSKEAKNGIDTSDDNFLEIKEYISKW